VDAANLVAQGTDFSLWGLFLEANFVVKLVMLGLLFASVWVWAVVFEKVVSLRKVNREATAFEDRFWTSCSTRRAITRSIRWPRCSPLQ
jgi:biopolymer transport protein TolQ